MNQNDVIKYAWQTNKSKQTCMKQELNKNAHINVANNEIINDKRLTKQEKTWMVHMTTKQSIPICLCQEKVVKST